VFGWEMGQNTGPSDPDFGARLGARVEEILDETQERISIIGQSLGGVYAREISKHGAEAIRQIIMLLSPLLGPGGSAKHVEEMYAEMTEGGSSEEPFPAYSDPTVPSTSIYSRLDGIVSWQNSIQADHHLAENIEVNVSHIGMAFSPAVLFIVAERLAQHDGDWQPFDMAKAHQRAWQRSLGYLQPAKLLG